MRDWGRPGWRHLPPQYLPAAWLRRLPPGADGGDVAELAMKMREVSACPLCRDPDRLLDPFRGEWSTAQADDPGIAGGAPAYLC